MVNNADLTWSLPVKMENLQVFDLRVGNISARQTGNTPDQIGFCFISFKLTWDIMLIYNLGCLADRPFLPTLFLVDL